jgi:cell division protein FtsB
MMVRVKRQNLTPMRLVRPLLWMFIAFYMGYHTLHGERGLFALMRDRHEVTQLTTELERTKSEREMMERRVSHLRDNSLDRDLLDEQMRRMLGVMKKGEIVVLTGQQG